MKDRVGDDIASNAISGEADDRIDDIQEGLSSGNSCEEFQGDDFVEYESDLMALTAYQNSKVFDKCCFLLAFGLC